MAPALSEGEIARELADYQVQLPGPALEQLSTYLELLLRWNQRINLTGLRDPRQMVRKLFGESLFLSQVVKVEGWLVDIGSGAGFPGLALKLVARDLRVTLVEARKKKCAFLREAARACGFSLVSVVDQRIEEWSNYYVSSDKPSLITTRAVRLEKKFLRTIRGLLSPGGRLVLMTVEHARRDVLEFAEGWSWSESVRIPFTDEAIVVLGRLLGVLLVITTKYYI